MAGCRLFSLQRRPRGLWALVGLVVLFPAALLASGDERPCEPELTAVFLVQGIYPGTVLNIETLHIHETGPHSFPDDAQLLNSVENAYSGDPMAPYYAHLPMGEAGHYRLYIAPPMDFGAATLVDLRDGAVVFAAEMIWMGMGATVHPSESTHAWQWEPGTPASPPEECHLMANPMWCEESFGSENYLAQVALDHIRQTDAMRSFGSCAPYQVTTFLHTPALGILDPNQAVQVLIVTGHAAPPWGPAPIDTRLTPWGTLKSYFQGNSLSGR